MHSLKRDVKIYFDVCTERESNKDARRQVMIDTDISNPIPQRKMSDEPTHITLSPV